MRVARSITPDDAAPSVRSHYRTFLPTMSDSVPVPRIGTLALAGAARLRVSLCIGATGSYVPHPRLNQGHAAFMPDASGAVHRSPSTCFAGQSLDPGFDVAFGLSTRHQRFTCVRLLDSYLTEYVPPFPATLTTKTLDLRRLPRFEICACTPTSRDLPSSWVKHCFHPYKDGCIRSTQTPEPFSSTLFPVDGDGSGGYGKMIACSEWPIALRAASSASAIGGGPQRKITVSGPGGGRCPRRMASVMRPVPCDQPAGGCSNT